MNKFYSFLIGFIAASLPLQALGAVVPVQLRPSFIDQLTTAPALQLNQESSGADPVLEFILGTGTGNIITAGPFNVQKSGLVIAPSIQLTNGAVSGYVWTDTDGLGNGSWEPGGGGGGGANQFLSNLLSPTAANQSINPGTSGSLDLGTFTGPHLWRNLNLSGTATADELSLQGTSSGAIGIFAATSGSAYNIHFPPAIASAAGQVLTSDTAGNLTWTTVSGGGGANTALSNLITTSINQSLVPNADNTLDLGSALDEWHDVRVGNVLYSNNWSNTAGSQTLSWAGVHINPGSDKLLDLGSSISRFADLFTVGVDLNGTTSGDVQLQASAVTTPYTNTWPAAVAASAGQVLTSDTAGVLSWTTPSSGATPRTTNTVSSAFSIPTPLTVDYILNVDTSAGAVAVNLPNAATSNGFCADVKNVGSPVNNVTVNTLLSQTIDGGPSDTLVDQYDAKHYCAVGGEWFNY